MANREGSGRSPQRLAIRSGVTDFRRQPDRVDADHAEGAAVFRVEIAVEDHLRRCRAVQPAVRLDLGLELSGGPAGIAEGEHGILRAGTARDGLEDFQRRGEADMLVDRQRRALYEIIRAVQDESAPGLYGAAAVDLHAAGGAGQADLGAFGDDIELDQEI